MKVRTHIPVCSQHPTADKPVTEQPSEEEGINREVGEELGLVKSLLLATSLGGVSLLEKLLLFIFKGQQTVNLDVEKMPAR